MICGLVDFIREGLNKCADCSDFIEKQIYKVKETEAIEAMKTRGIIFSSLDKPIDGGCTKYRPDAIIDKNSFIIVTEIDEHQHQSYACECEQARMISLFQKISAKHL